MKVLLNGLQLGKNNSGVQYYSYYLNSAIKEIENNTIKLSLYTGSKNFFLSFFNYSLMFSRIARILFENLCLPSYLKQKHFNVYHSPNYVIPFFIKSPSVITVHDLITFDFPKLCQTESVLYFRLFLPKSLKKATKIITVSETTKKDIVKRFKIPEHKIVVIHLGVSSIFRRTISPQLLTKYRITEKYILFVGNIEPKKNLVRVLKAYHSLIHTKNITHQFVIGGKKGWKYNEVFKTVQSLKLQNQVIFTGYVPEKDLPGLYSMADLFVFPSIYEGFGIPPLEAMACETPVLASNTGALPESTGGNCLLVDPYNVDDIADGMINLLTKEQLRKEYVERGKNWVKHFTWETTARKTMEVYKKIMKKIEIGERRKKTNRI